MAEWHSARDHGISLYGFRRHGPASASSPSWAMATNHNGAMKSTPQTPLHGSFMDNFPPFRWRLVDLDQSGARRVEVVAFTSVNPAALDPHPKLIADYVGGAWASRSRTSRAATSFSTATVKISCLRFTWPVVPSGCSFCSGYAAFGESAWSYLLAVK